MYGILKSLVNYILDTLHIKLWREKSFALLGPDNNMQDNQVDGFFKLTEEMNSEIKKIIHDDLEKYVESGFVLDAGCGTGRLLLLFNDSRFTCMGIDINESSLARARGKNPNAKFLNIDLTKKTDFVKAFTEEYEVIFHIVFSYSVIEFMQIHELKEFLHNISMILKKGGYLNIVFPVPKNFIDKWEAKTYRRHELETVNRFLIKNNFEIMLSEVNKKLPWTGHVLARKI